MRHRSWTGRSMAARGCPSRAFLRCSVTCDGANTVRDFAPEDKDVAAEAREVLGVGEVEITEFAHGQRIGVTAGVARMRGGGRSAVVKVISPGRPEDTWRGSHDPASYRFWR